MNPAGARLAVGFCLPAIAAAWLPAREAFPGEGPSLTCSLPKKSFLLGEPVTLTCRIEGAPDRMPREPWFLELSTLHVSMQDQQGRPAQAKKLPYPNWVGFEWEGARTVVDVETHQARALIFQRDLIGSLFVPEFYGSGFTLEMKRSQESRDLMAAYPRYEAGRYSLVLEHKLRAREAREPAGAESLRSSLELELVEVPEDEKRAFELISVRPPLGVGVARTRLRRPDGIAAAMARYGELYSGYPKSVYAIWAKYFRAKLLADGKQWFEAARILDELPAADEEKRLPNYEVAYLRALCAEKTGNAAKARKILADSVPEGVMVFLDCAETGEQHEGWRLFRLQRNLGRAPGEERPGYGPRPPVPRALDAVFNDTATDELRRKAIGVLPDDLPPESREALRWLLRRQDESDNLRSALGDKLRRSGDEKLASDLTEMLRDGMEAPERRRACVSELRYLYEEERDPQIIGALFEAAQAEDETVVSAAIWSLTGLAELRDGRPKLDGETVERVKGFVLDVAGKEDADRSARTAGILSCASLGVVEVLPVIRGLAERDPEKEREAWYLRAIAIKALGELGTEEDARLLERLAGHKDRLVQRPAKMALEKLRARLAGPR